MAQFEHFAPGELRKQDQETLAKLMCDRTPEEIEKVKKLFWETVEKSGGPEKYKKLYPGWCQAIEALPDTDAFKNVDNVDDARLGLSIDLIKRALETKE